MKVLVVHAHPVETSFSAALCRTVVDALGRAGHGVTTLDLYAEDFDARLSRRERLDYHDPARNTATVERYVAMLRDAEGLVFVFPVWCMGAPAILKGFFDRVLVPGFAFILTQDGRVEPNLRHIRKLGAVATYGVTRWLAFGMGDIPRKQITRYVRWFCHPRVETLYLAQHDMNRATDAIRRRFLDRTARAMARF